MRLRNYALALSISLAACAHAPVQPIVISSHLLDAAGMTFETVAAGMVSASQRDALTPEQVAAWNDFTVRWAVGYGKSVTAWIEAKNKLDRPAADQAAELIADLLRELGTWNIIVMGAS